MSEYSVDPELEALLAACDNKLVQLQNALIQANMLGKNSDELLDLSNSISSNLHVPQSFASESLKRACTDFCSIMDRANAKVEDSSTKGCFASLFSCTSGDIFAEIKNDLRLLSVRVSRLTKHSATAQVTGPPSTTPDHSVRPTLSHDHSYPIKSTTTLALSRKIRKPSRQETISAMCFVAPTKQVETDTWRDPQGRVWLYIDRFMGTDKLLVHNIASDVQEQADGIRNEGAVTAIHSDQRGVLWTGHRSGAVIAWKEDERKMLCNSVRVVPSSIRTITTDESGFLWVGSEKGDVRRVSLVTRVDTNECEIQVHRYLRHTGAGTPERSATADIDPATQMVKNLRAKEKAHEGAVTSLAAAAGRIWTSGGSAAFVCLREWTQRGEFVKKHDLKSIGAATTMILVSPIVRATNAADSTSSLASTFSGSMESSILMKSTEIAHYWQLLTGHANGVIQVWGDFRGSIAPILRIGSEGSPITSIGVHAPLGLICSSHLDGKVVVHSVPHPNGQSALSVALLEGSVSAVKLRKGKVKVIESGIASMAVRPYGAVAVGYDSSVTYLPSALLRSVAEDAGIAISEPSNLPDQWPFCQMYPHDIQAASNSMRLLSRPTHHTSDVTGANGGVKFSDAARWQIDFNDLTLSRVVGEGAFGKVYLGRWHETDVAIKMLSSLSALGIKEGATAAATESIRTLEREVGLMVSMRHPNVILFMGLCPDPPCVVTEFCSKGSLYDLLQEACREPNLAGQLHWPRRLGLALDAAKGMLYLHSHKPPIIHRDLKSPNLLVDGHWRAKVTDFNLSRLSEATPAIASSLTAGNPRWQAPEVIRSRNFSASGDVYAFGLLLWELACWEVPYEQLSQFQIMLMVGEKGLRPDIPDPSSPLLRGGSFPGYDDYVALMKSCWAQDPAERPGFDQIINELRKIASGLGTGGSLNTINATSTTSTTTTMTPTAATDAQHGTSHGVLPPPHHHGPSVMASPFDTTSPPPTTGRMTNGIVPSPFDSATVDVPVPPVSPFDTAASAGASSSTPHSGLLPSTTAAGETSGAQDKVPPPHINMVSPFDDTPTVAKSATLRGTDLRMIDSAADSLEGHIPPGSHSTTNTHSSHQSGY